MNSKHVRVRVHTSIVGMYSCIFPSPYYYYGSETDAFAATFVLPSDLRPRAEVILPAWVIGMSLPEDRIRRMHGTELNRKDGRRESIGHSFFWSSITIARSMLTFGYIRVEECAETRGVCGALLSSTTAVLPPYSNQRASSRWQFVYRSYTSWARQGQLLFYFRPAHSRPLGTHIMPPTLATTGRCCCSGSLPTVEKWNSIWFFAEKLRNYLFSVKCQHYSYTNGRQPMPLVLGVNIPWGMPQAQELLLLIPPINSSNLHHQDGMACIRYILFKVKMFTWDPQKKKTILTRVFLCSTSIFLHAFLTGKTKAFITAAQKQKNRFPSQFS